jgi:hypothetical protein
MKKYFVLFFVITAFSLKGYSQLKNSLSVVAGASANNINRGNMIGGPSYEGKGGWLYGLKYTRSLSSSFSVETGLQYSSDKIQVSSEFMPNVPRIVRNDQVKIVSVPVYASFSFLKYLFLNAGLSADFETDHPADLFDDQSGISLGAGIGGKVNFDKVSVFINPFVQQHAVISFKDANEHLFNAGVKLGVGYRF